LAAAGSNQLLRMTLASTSAHLASGDEGVGDAIDLTGTDDAMMLLQLPASMLAR
jgi:hypothetical protein